MKALSESELMTLLHGVSRSFVLTIRALPRELRRPIGLAYLLARASDTIADTASAPVELRINVLGAFVEAIEGAGTQAFAGISGISPSNPLEQSLLDNLARVVASLAEIEERDHREIVALLQKITRGQELDLLRFSDSEKIVALKTADELNEYTYLVAGCVGEFWTRICSSHLPGYGRLGLDDLCRFGRHFGQGLQLVNILRDLPEDLRNGRCYLPSAELALIGITNPNDLRFDPAQANPVFGAWHGKAVSHLRDARRYIEAIRPWRIRFACLLPWALGVRTLHLMEEHSPLEHDTPIKVPRKEVGKIMRRALFATLSNASIRKWADEAA